MKMNDGHFNSSDRYKGVIDIAKKWHFLLKSIDMSKKSQSDVPQ
jgi:hypothetical protein